MWHQRKGDIILLLLMIHEIHHYYQGSMVLPMSAAHAEYSSEELLYLT